MATRPRLLQNTAEGATFRFQVLITASVFGLIGVGVTLVGGVVAANIAPPVEWFERALAGLQAASWFAAGTALAAGIIGAIVSRDASADEGSEGPEQGES